MHSRLTNCRTIETDLALNDAIESVYRLSTDLDDQLGGGATLEEAAGVLGLEVAKIEAVDQSGQTPFDPPPKSPRLVSSSRHCLIPNWYGLLLEQTENDGYFVLRTDTIEETRIPELDEVHWQQLMVAEQRFLAAEDERPTGFSPEQWDASGGLPRNRALK